MIKINLATGKQSNIIAQKGTQASSFGIIKNIDFEEFKELPLRKVLPPILIAIIANYSLENYKTTKTEELDLQINQIRSSHDLINTDLKKSITYDELKKSLTKDETLIKNKIKIIHELLSGRSFVYDLLVSISKSIPENVWLSELTLNGKDLTLKGQAVDLSQISDFMKNMNENALLEGITLKNTQQSINKISKIEASFEMTAKRR
jgi:hypothetical protein